MLILGIDTATSRSSVALVNDATVMVSTSSQRPRRHGEFVAPAIAYCLSEAAVQIADLDAIAVDVGPGLYTGMRVGIGVAQTLAAAGDVKTVGVTSTDALAHTVSHLTGRVLVSLDGRRGEVFVATYDVALGVVTPVLAPCVMPHSEALAMFADTPVVAVVGDGFDDTALDTFDVPASARFRSLPDAIDVATIGHERAVAHKVTRPDALQPVYLRQADAKIGWETRGKLGGDSAA